MNKLPIKISKSEIQKTDNKLDFFNEIIENSLTSKCDSLYQNAKNFCGTDCKKTFEICDEIIESNPQYIQAYLAKIRCKKRKDNISKLSECEELLIKFPKYNTKIKFQKLSIIRQIKNRKEELEILIKELYSLTDIEIGDNYDELAIGFSELKMHEKSIECYTKYILRNPTKSFAFNNRGIQFENIGQFENSISDFQKSIDLIEALKDNKNDESLQRSKRNLIRVQNKLNSQNNDLLF